PDPSSDCGADRTRLTALAALCERRGADAEDQGAVKRQRTNVGMCHMFTLRRREYRQPGCLRKPIRGWRPRISDDFDFTPQLGVRLRCARAAVLGGYLASDDWTSIALSTRKFQLGGCKRRVGARKRVNGRR